MNKKPLPFFLQSIFWLLVSAFEAFKWATGWWYEGNDNLQYSITLYVILRRIEWEVEKPQIPWFTNSN